MSSNDKYNPFYYSFPTKYCFGKGALNRIESLIDEFSIKNVLILTGKRSSEQLGIDSRLTKSLKKKGITFKVLKGFCGNPKKSQARYIADVIENDEIEFVIAVGGGSVIDLAKAAIYYNGKFDIRLGTILTMPASGSEANRSFVLVDNEKGRKISIADNRILPLFAICDPNYINNLEEIQLKSCLSDIMGHLLEQYFCKEPSNYIDIIILSSIQYLDNIARRILVEGDDIACWAEDIVLMSSVALSYALSSGRTMDWFVHEVEHGLSTFSSYSHGLGIAVLMPKWVAYSQKNIYYMDKLNELAIYMNLNSVKAAIDYIESFYELAGVPHSLTNLLDCPPCYEELADMILDGRENLGRVNIMDVNSIIGFLKYTDDCI